MKLFPPTTLTHASQLKPKKPDSVHNALYFVKYPSRAAESSLEGRRRPAGRGLKTPALDLMY